MPWTASRSRDEWLAEVRRRGARLRRRRRLLVALAGVVAVALPTAGAITVLGGAGGRPVELHVAGPAGVAGSTTVPELLAPSTTVDTGPTSTVEIHRRIAAVNGLPVPASPASTVPATGDTLDVRAVHDAPAPPGRPPIPGVTSSVAAAPPSTTVPADAPTCAPADVKVAVTTTKAFYAPGEMVSGYFTLVKDLASNCRLERTDADGVLYTRSSVRYEDASGKIRAADEMTTMSSPSVPASYEPQASYTRGFVWDQRDSYQKDCTVMPCLQVPAGTYAVILDWSGGGTDAGRASIQIGS